MEDGEGDVEMRTRAVKKSLTESLPHHPLTYDHFSGTKLFGEQVGFAV